MATSKQLAQQLASYDKGRKSSASVMNEAMGKYGVPEIRQRVSGLRTTLSNTENALDAVDPSVTGRTSRSLVTEAQRRRIVNQEREPIAAQYGDQSQALSNENANLSAQERAANMFAQGVINDYDKGRSALLDRYNSAVAREAEQRRQREADRAYKLQKLQADRSYQLSQRKAASSGGSGNSDIITQLNSALSGAAGNDGYVSPQSYAAARRDWISQGLSSSAFDKTFAAYRNPYSEDRKNGKKRSLADYAVG